jgi:hypothetical protein
MMKMTRLDIKTPRQAVAKEEAAGKTRETIYEKEENPTHENSFARPMALREDETSGA